MSGILFSVILKRRIKIINQLSDNIIFQSTHDALTKLPNRVKSSEVIDSRIKSNPQSVFALVSLDLR
jgi:GGDEF domain-containing protein